MMEHKQDNADPVSKVTTPAGGTPSKSVASDVAKNVAPPSANKSKDAGTSASRAPLDFDEPDDGVEAPANPVRNKLREYRIENMMSKAELARKAGLSVLTVARIEKGYDCRMDTKRKLLKALGLKLADRRKVFEDE